MKLELGSGHRGTPGYVHSDINNFEDVDIVSPAWDIALPDESCDEIIALGVIEHLRYREVDDTLANCYRMLKPGGAFYFDVPNLPVWAGYLVKIAHGYRVPFTREHIYATIHGWQRWEGDEHKSGWDYETIKQAVDRAGFEKMDDDVQRFLKHGLDRRRMHRAEDAHIYVIAEK